MMYLVRKALRNLRKNKIRNAVVFMMLFIAILASMVSLTLFNVTRRIYAETENYYAGEVTIAYGDGSGTAPELSADQWRLYADSAYLRSYAFYKCMPVVAVGLELIDGEYYTEESPGSGQKAMSAPNARVYALLDEQSHDDFSYGERTIIRGSFPDSAAECMLSSELAQRNGLTLGDTVTFILGRDQSENTLTISGIYADSTVELRQANHRSPALNARNDIIVPYEFLEGFDDAMDAAASFLLKNAEELNDFQEELYAKGLPKSCVVQYDTTRYNGAIAEISGMSKIVTLFFSIIALMGTSVVFLINLFALRERQYEIGVLRAVGMPKTKVVFLLVSEMMVLASAGIALAVIAGIFLNPPVVAYMMRLEINRELPSALKSAVNGINSALSPIAVLELIASTGLLVLLSGSATIASIVRFDPTQILAERN
ncbi:MAG TPA: FtsX-like permease family protein [Clostridia bacterium]|nr:FtsX-like permease family protein [Clostridia bacterium]